MDVLDEDLEDQVEDVTLDAPESVENRSNTDRNAEGSEVLSSRMLSYYPCIPANFVLFDAL